LIPHYNDFPYFLLSFLQLPFYAIIPSLYSSFGLIFGVHHNRSRIHNFFTALVGASSFCAVLSGVDTFSCITSINEFFIV
ncbi:MAG: hypothetical protein LBS23_01210, partial [Holosporaceae bacterium]|nr:hypothetical protein [Holosporaceae bacterium]